MVQTAADDEKSYQRQLPPIRTTDQPHRRRFVHVLIGSSSWQSLPLHDDDDDDYDEYELYHRRPCDKRVWSAIGAVLAVSLYLFTWVANAEFVQGLSTGAFNAPAYDKPTFISWFSYNFLFLGSCIPVGIYLVVQKMTFGTFVHKWVGSNGAAGTSIIKVVGAICGMVYVVLILNITWIIGLVHVSVATSNAVYQLQMVATLALSVWILKRPFRCFSLQTLGIAISMFGVALIVVPPLLIDDNDENGENDDDSSTSSSRRPIFGIVVTLTSSILWAFYQISWRLLALSRKPDNINTNSTTPTPTERLEGLMDTLFTVAMIGLCNFLIGWPVLVWMHVTKLEVFEWPSSNQQWLLLMCKGWIEFSFDASIAVAIYMTSPVLTAMTCPLIIPISFLWDQWMWSSSSSAEDDDGSTDSNSGHGLLAWFGAFLVLVGVVVVEKWKPTTTTPSTLL
eukprot:CAMPEP_0194065852 /NCGR_PEP_ID=MMETSP0009_2-20130614/85694_1 /TAXON_ID=210454 /ORGANISM="Grammatophora oceanica, Strain CCMP 410" /LENGTH=450 /DNA_ID=CAMNT_0038718743 /DNA_START=67 /DNA_END=1419 /DNA_ORIENTATION=+